MSPIDVYVAGMFSFVAGIVVTLEIAMVTTRKNTEILLRTAKWIETATSTTPEAKDK